MGPKLGWLDYIWITDGADNLNLELVRTGKLLGGTMADAVQYLTSINNEVHVDTKDLDFPERLVGDEAYAAFMKKVVAAEIAARADKVGLWSDKNRQMMKEEGFLPSRPQK